MNRLKIEEIKRRRYEERQQKAFANAARSPIERPITYILSKRAESWMSMARWLCREVGVQRSHPIFTTTVAYLRSAALIHTTLPSHLVEAYNPLKAYILNLLN